MDTPQSPEPTPGGDDGHRMPRWVKGFILAAVAAVVLAVVVVLAIGSGGHGPSRHLPDGDASVPSPHGAHPAGRPRMTMSPTLRKAALAVHLTVSVGWIGGVVAYLSLGLWAINTTDDQSIRVAWAAMDTIGWYAIVPLAVAALATGLLMALGTRWGLFRHYWVVISLILTMVAVVVLLLHMPDVTVTAQFAARASGDQLADLGGDLAHPAIGLALLLVIQTLNVYKPKGLTRYGQRRQRQ